MRLLKKLKFLLVSSLIFTCAYLIIHHIFFSVKKTGFKNQISKASQFDVPILTLHEGKIENGIYIYEVLKSLGVSHDKIMNFIKIFKETYNLKNVRKNHRYKVYLTPKKEINKFVYETGPYNQYIAEKQNGSDFKTFKKSVRFEKEIIAKVFKIDSSLYQAVKDGGENDQMVMDIANIFSWDIDFFLFPQKGDKIKVVFEKLKNKDKFVKYGKILYAQYISKKKSYYAILYDNGKRTGYYDLDGSPMQKMFLKMPIQFGRVTSSYSIKRFHPVDKRYRKHNGIDYGASVGTPIHSTADGVVVHAGWKGGYGKVVIIKNSNGYKTFYAHCQKVLVRRNQHVKQGKIIARVGRTGKVTGPHIHYEVRYKNKPVNPATLSVSKASPINKRIMNDFVKVVNKRITTIETLLNNKKESPVIAISNKEDDKVL